MKYVNGRRTELVTFGVETAFIQRVIEGKIKGWIEVTGRRGSRRRKLPDNLNTLRTGSFKLFKRPFPGFFFF